LYQREVTNIKRGNLIRWDILGFMKFDSTLVKVCGETEKPDFFCPFHDRLMLFHGGVSLLVEIIGGLAIPQAFFITDEELTLGEGDGHRFSDLSLEVKKRFDSNP